MMSYLMPFAFFFSSRRRHTRWTGDWSSDVCSSDLHLASSVSNRASSLSNFWSIDFRRSRRLTSTPARRELSWVISPSILDRKSTRLNSSHPSISYAVFCLKKKKLDWYHGVQQSPDT